MGRSRYRILEKDAPCFMTMTIVRWLPVFSHPEIARVVIDSLRFLQEQKRISIFAFVIMENHLHLVASADDISKQIKEFKSYTAHEILKTLKQLHMTETLAQLSYGKPSYKKDSAHQVWQEGTHAEQILGESMLRQKIDYIHNNPVRRGYVDDPCHWRYSSASAYAGLSSLLEVQTEWIFD